MKTATILHGTLGSPNGVTVHNPDSHDDKSNQQVSWELLDQAWKEFGGSYSLYAFRKDTK